MPIAIYAQPLTLNEAIELALRHNPQLLASQADRHVADRVVQTQKSQFLPKASLHLYGDIENNEEGLQATDSRRLGLSPRISYHSIVGTELHLQWNQTLTQGNQSTPRESGQWQIHIEQPLLKGVRPQINREGERDALFQKKMTQHQNHETRARVLLMVIQNYALLYNTWQSYEQKKIRLENQRELAKIIHEKIKLGRMSEVDGMAFKIQLDKLELALNQTRMQLVQQSQQLARLLGKELLSPQPLAPLELGGALKNKSTDYQHLALNSQLEPLEWQQDHLKEQEERLRDQALWDLRLKGVMSMGRQAYHYDESFDYQLPRHVHANKHRYLGLFLTIPLSKQSVLEGSLYQNKMNQYKKTLDYHQMRQDIKQKVNHLTQQIDYWQQQHKIAQQSYRLAQKTLAIEQKKYLAGYASFYDWQKAQEMELGAAMDEQSMLIGHFLACVELDYLSGLLPTRWPIYVQ